MIFFKGKSSTLSVIVALCVVSPCHAISSLSEEQMQKYYVPTLATQNKALSLDTEVARRTTKPTLTGDNSTQTSVNQVVNASVEQRLADMLKASVSRLDENGMQGELVFNKKISNDRLLNSLPKGKRKTLKRALNSGMASFFPGFAVSGLSLEAYEQLLLNTDEKMKLSFRTDADSASFRLDNTSGHKVNINHSYVPSSAGKIEVSKVTAGLQLVEVKAYRP